MVPEHKNKKKTEPRPLRVAGIHLSGPNVHKTSIVILKGTPMDGPLEVIKVYEKIGSFGSLFSDERLVEVLIHEGPFDTVFVDCPLTVPPCVACTRNECPGVLQCDDISVAYILSLAEKVKKLKKRVRPVNPQAQRVWDILQLLDKSQVERSEPSYSSNMAPLVTRAKTLQRRLNSIDSGIKLGETSIPHVFLSILDSFGLKPEIRREYRNFECGLDRRTSIVKKMKNLCWIETDAETETALAGSVETFNAFITAWVAALYRGGLSKHQPEGFIEPGNWVHVPHISDRVEFPQPIFEYQYDS